MFLTPEDENRFYEKNPGIHLVKAIVVGRTTHIWVAENKHTYNGGHMQPGGATNE
jgi:hypothetical protein